jgi:hypothetical protein
MPDVTLRLVRGCAEEIGVVVLGQMVPQQEQPRHVHLSALNHAKSDREPANEARRRNTTARLVIAHPQPSNAEVE